MNKEVLRKVAILLDDNVVQAAAYVRQFPEEFQSEFNQAIASADSIKYQQACLKLAASQVLPYTATPLSPEGLAQALKKGYELAFGKTPTAEVLASGWAQVALENAQGQKIYNNNFGNLKATQKWVDSGLPYAMKTTGEFSKEGKFYKEKDAKWQVYPSPELGAAAYWKLIGKRYNNAHDWMAAGDPKSAAVSLGLSGYYTANIKQYSNGVSNLYRQFMETIAPKLGVKSMPAPPPGQAPEIKNWASDYSTQEKSSLSQAPGDMAEMDQMVKNLLSEDLPLTNMVKTAMIEESLPLVKAVILVAGAKSLSKGNYSQIEFAKLASKLLSELGAKTEIRDNSSIIEINYQIHGNPKEVIQAGQALCDCISEGLKLSTGFTVVGTVYPGSSTNPKIGLDRLFNNTRLFRLEKLAAKIK